MLINYMTTYAHCKGYYGSKWGILGPNWVQNAYFSRFWDKNP